MHEEQNFSNCETELSREMCFSKGKAGAEKNKLNAIPFSMRSWWFVDFQCRSGIPAFNIGWQRPTKSFVSPAIQKQPKNKESKYKAILKFNFSLQIGS